jgi:uncharacterized protein involved in exopolysaccharide biosynthesis
MADELSCVRKHCAHDSSFSARDLAAVIFRQQRIALITLVVVFSAGLIYATFGSTYQAQMKILVRRGRIDPPITAQATEAIDSSRNQVTEEELNSEAELLRDSEILRQVVLTTGLDGASKKFWSRESADARVDSAVRQLARKLVIEPVHKTTIIGVKYDSRDPSTAAQVLEELANIYTQKHRQLQRPVGEFTFFEQEAAQYGEALKAAQADLLQFTQSRGVVSAALERDMEIRKLSEADAAYRQVQVESAANEQKIQSLRKKLASLPERSTTEVRTSDNPQLQEHLKATLLDLELKRTELLTKYEPTYRLVQEVETQIAQTKAAVSAENLSPVRDETTAKDASFEWTKAELEKAEVERDSLRARGAACGIVLASYQSGAKNLATDSVRQENLLRTVKTNEDRYLLYLRKQEEARIGDALDARGILNVTVAQQPRIPALPTRSFAFVAGLSLFCAVGSSVGAAFAADYLDPSFRTPEEVKRYLAAPVVASFPRRSA